MTEKKITIKDIARDCGVGLGTVSRVINSKPGVKDEIRRKVQQYIEDIGWRSNSLSNRLKLPEAGRTVVFISSTTMLERKYDQDLFRVTLEQCIALGFSPVTLFGQCRENLERCLKMKPYAVIIAGVNSFQKELVKNLLCNGIRTVCLGECDEFAGPLVFPNHRKAAAKAVKRLNKAGHQNIGFFGGMGIMHKLMNVEDINIRRIKEMLYGIRDSHSTFNTETDAVSDCFCDLSNLKKILKTGKHTAWICSDEKLCRQLLYTARELKLTVPNDFSLISFTQDLPFYSFDIDVNRFYPDNTTMGQTVMELLNGPLIPEPTVFNCDYRFHSGATIKEL